MYEDMDLAMLLLYQEDYMFLFNLKSGYHYIDKFKPHRQLLWQCWKQEGTNRFKRS